MSKAQATRKRNSRIYTELQIMAERLLGCAPNVHSDGYQKLMKQVRRYFTPLMIEKEQTK